MAYLSNGDAQSLIQQRTLSSTREYPIVVAFTEGDPLDEEVRTEVPRPPQPSVNRARGRIGFDYMGTVSHGTPSSMNIGCRHGHARRHHTYWRHLLESERLLARTSSLTLGVEPAHVAGPDQPHLSPGNVLRQSRLASGSGSRATCILPWAPSLDTIDGGYFGAKLGTWGYSWAYSPVRLPIQPRGVTTLTGASVGHSSTSRVATMTLSTTPAHPG